MSEEIKETMESGCGCGHNHEHDHSHDHGGCGCGDDCGCGGHDHTPDVITLTLDNDEEVECAVLGIFEVESQDYIALLPDGSDDVFIYIYLEDAEGNVSLENIESQEKFDEVSAVFLEIIESEDEDEE